MFPWKNIIKFLLKNSSSSCLPRHCFSPSRPTPALTPLSLRLPGTSPPSSEALTPAPPLPATPIPPAHPLSLSPASTLRPLPRLSRPALHAVSSSVTLCIASHALFLLSLLSDSLSPLLPLPLHFSPPASLLRSHLRSLPPARPLAPLPLLGN